MTTLRLLGKPQVFLQDWLEPALGKPFCLLAYLAYSESWVGREQLAFMFWPDTDDASAKRNLRQLVKRAKELDFAQTLEVEAARLRWSVATDVQAFRAAIAQQNHQEAVSLYRGELLSGLHFSDGSGFETWLELERESLYRAWSEAIFAAARRLEHEEQYEQAAQQLQKLLDLDNLAEDVLRHYLRVAYLAGQRDAALSTFERFVKRLKAELDLEPLPETSDLVQMIRNSTPLEIRAQPAESRPLVPLMMLRPPKLIGMESERDLVLRASTPVVILAGEAGSGKSRLMAELAPEALLIRSQEGLQQIPFYPLLGLLRQGSATVLQALGHYLEDLARLVPELAPQLIPGPANPETGRGRLFEALARFLEISANKTAHFHLLIDDLQWADEASLSFLIYLANKQSLRILGAYRNFEVSQQLGKTLQSLSSSQLLSIIKLEPLKPEAIAQLLASLIGVPEGPPIFSRWLQDKTGGNPMFALETLKSLFESGILKSNQEGWHTHIDELTRDYRELEVPQAVAEVIRRRIQNLAGETRRLLQTAAVIGEGFEIKHLSQISGLSDWAALEAYEEAEASGIVSANRFNHDLLRQSIYGELTVSRKRLLHERVAQVLENNLEASVLAEHWHAAGHLDLAIQKWLEAADALRNRSLHQDAMHILERAGELAKNTDLLWPVKAAQANIHRERSDFDTAEALIKEVLANNPSMRTRAFALNTLAIILSHQGKLERALEAATEGLAFVDTETDAPLNQSLRASIAHIAFYQGKYEKALELLEPILKSLRRLPPSVELSSVLTSIASIYDRQERFEEALPLHLEALDVAKKIGANYRQVDASLNLLYCYMELGRAEEGLPLAQAALELGRYEGTDVLRNNLAMAYFELKQFNKAQHHYERLCQDSADPTLLCVAWSRLAELYHQEKRSAEAQRALLQALEQAQHTEFDIAKARMIIAAFQFGTETLQQEASKLIPGVQAQALPSYLKAEFEALLKRL